MPRISFLPPEAESPEEGSKTPILMTLSLDAPLPEEAQAHRDSAMQTTRRIATNFFIFFSSISKTNPLAADICFYDREHYTELPSKMQQVISYGKASKFVSFLFIIYKGSFIGQKTLAEIRTKKNIRPDVLYMHFSTAYPHPKTCPHRIQGTPTSVGVILRRIN